MENCATLCSTCHIEWHRHAESSVLWDEWVCIPTAQFLIMFAADERMEDKTISDIQNIWMMTRLFSEGIGFNDGMMTDINLMDRAEYVPPAALERANDVGVSALNQMFPDQPPF